MRYYPGCSKSEFRQTLNRGVPPLAVGSDLVIDDAPDKKHLGCVEGFTKWSLPPEKRVFPGADF